MCCVGVGEEEKKGEREKGGGLVMIAMLLVGVGRDRGAGEVRIGCRRFHNLVVVGLFACAFHKGRRSNKTSAEKGKEKRDRILVGVVRVQTERGGNVGEDVRREKRWRGGKVRVSDSERKGSCFSFSLCLLRQVIRTHHLQLHMV